MTLRCNHPHRIKRLRKLIQQACEHVAREYNSTQVLLNWMINGLAALIVAQYEMVPNHSSVYVLYNRAADRVKCLYKLTILLSSNQLVLLQQLYDAISDKFDPSP